MSSAAEESHLLSGSPLKEGAEILCAEEDESAARNLAPSPRLSRRTQKEVVAENDTTSSPDPDNYPLHSPWSFWFDKSHRGANAGDFFANLRPLATVTSIKAFWCVFNNLPTCDKLKERESYHLMRGERRRPVWEDADNADGGLWVIKVEKQQTVKVWQELLLAAVGEQLSLSVDVADEICGVSVRIRYDGDVIQIWNQDSELHSKATVLEKVQELVPSIEIKSTYYQSNQEKMRDSLKPVSSHHHHHHHHGPSPPPPAMLQQPSRYTGAPPPLFPPRALPAGYPRQPHPPHHAFFRPPPFQQPRPPHP